MEEVLTQVLASDSDKSDIEIESDDSYDQEEDFQANTDQCFENFDKKEVIPSDSVWCQRFQPGSFGSCSHGQL